MCLLTFNYISSSEEHLESTRTAFSAPFVAIFSLSNFAALEPWPLSGGFRGVQLAQAYLPIFTDRKGR